MEARGSYLAAFPISGAFKLRDDAGRGPSAGLTDFMRRLCSRDTALALSASKESASIMQVSALASEPAHP